MWAFSLNKFFGFDKICYLTLNNKKTKLSPWDLIKDGDSFFIILWNSVEYKSLYNKFIYKLQKIEILEKHFLYPQTLKLIHRMCKTRFTSYKKIFNLFLPTFEVDKILKYKKNKKKKINPQELFLFPDLWTAYNILWNLNNLYSSHNTIIQKIKLFRDIKSWKSIKLFCTHSNIFQDWVNLKKITVYYPHKRYYKNQQDPRYHTIEVIKKMKEIYNCDLEMINDYVI